MWHDKSAHELHPSCHDRSRTASLGLVVVEALGMPAPTLVNLGIGALVIATGSIATDLDHPKSFISNSIPSHVIRIALAVLVIPLLAGLAALLTAPDPRGTWTELAGLVFWSKFPALGAFRTFGSPRADPSFLAAQQEPASSRSASLDRLCFGDNSNSLFGLLVVPVSLGMGIGLRMGLAVAYPCR